MIKHGLGAMLCVAISLWFGSGRVAADEFDSKSQTYVIIVGASTFNDPAIQPRPSALTDAQALYDTLSDPKYLGVPKQNVKYLVCGEDPKRPAIAATRDNILKAFKWVAETAERDDKVIVALFGQGAAYGDRSCYFGQDSNFKDRAKTAVLSADLEAALEKLKSQRVAAFIDIGFKGVDAGKELLVEPPLGDMLKVFFGSEEADESAGAASRVVFMATNNTAVPPLVMDGQTIFAKFLIEALQGKADTEGGEPDGLIVVDEVKEYLDREIPKLSRKIGKTQQEKEQAAFIFGAANSHFALTRNPALTATVNQRLEAIRELKQANKLTAKVAEEGVRLLSRMPKLKAQRELRKEFERLAEGKLPVAEFLKARSTILNKLVLNKEEADDFARKVMAGATTVSKDYVKEYSPAELVGYAVKGLYKQIDEKIPTEIKDALEEAKANKANSVTLREILSNARLQLGKREDLDKGKDVDYALKAMMRSLDPYSEYIDTEMLKSFQDRMKGEFSGIGIQIRRDGARDGLLVTSPLMGSPAYKKGVRAGDLITEIIRDVDSEGREIPEERISTKGMKIDEAVKKIQGRPGTKVKIVVEREGEPAPIVFEITRGKIETETVLGYKRDASDQWEYYLDPQSKIAYIRLTEFGPRSAQQMRDLVQKLASEGMRGLILDLRFNPGGLLSAAVQICDMFIDDGVIVRIRPRGRPEEVYNGERENSFLNFPMVVLINGRSASGSEIVAACLQEHGRAIIVGERSYGKGSVQNIRFFAPTGGQLKLTTATFHPPRGGNLNKASIKGYQKMTPEQLEKEVWGVRPSPGFEIKLSRSDRETLEEQLRVAEIIGDAKASGLTVRPDFRDEQLEAGLNYLREQIRIAGKGNAKQGG